MDGKNAFIGPILMKIMRGRANSSKFEKRDILCNPGKGFFMNFLCLSYTYLEGKEDGKCMQNIKLILEKKPNK